jgi:hypothetical protein
MAWEKVKLLIKDVSGAQVEVQIVGGSLNGQVKKMSAKNFCKLVKPWMKQLNFQESDVLKVIKED